MNLQNFQLFYTMILEDVKYQLKNFPINKVGKCLCIKTYIHDYYFENQNIQEWNTIAIYKVLSLLTDSTYCIFFYMLCKSSPCFEKVLVCFHCDYCACLFFCLPNLLSVLDGFLHPSEKHSRPRRTFLKCCWEWKLKGGLMHIEVRSSSLPCGKLVVQGWVIIHLPLSEFFLCRIVKRFLRSSASMFEPLGEQALGDCPRETAHCNPFLNHRGSQSPWRGPASSSAVNLLNLVAGNLGSQDIPHRKSHAPPPHSIDHPEPPEPPYSHSDHSSQRLKVKAIAFLTLWEEKHLCCNQLFKKEWIE